MQMEPDPMLKLAVKLAEVDDAYEKACKVLGDCEERRAGVGAAEEMIETVSELWQDVQSEIAETPATSLEGILIKVRILAKDLEDGVTDWGEEIAKGVIRDVEALIAAARTRAV